MTIKKSQTKISPLYLTGANDKRQCDEKGSEVSRANDFLFSCKVKNCYLHWLNISNMVFHNKRLLTT